MKETRATCAVEAYNGVLGRKIMGKIRFFKFVAHLQEEELAKSIEFEQHIDAGGYTRPAKKAKYVVCIYFVFR